MKAMILLFFLFLLKLNTSYAIPYDFSEYNGRWKVQVYELSGDGKSFDYEMELIQFQPCRAFALISPLATGVKVGTIFSGEYYDSLSFNIGYKGKTFRALVNFENSKYGTGYWKEDQYGAEYPMIISKIAVNQSLKGQSLRVKFNASRIEFPIGSGKFYKQIESEKNRLGMYVKNVNDNSFTMAFCSKMGTSFSYHDWKNYSVKMEEENPVTSNRSILTLNQSDPVLGWQVLNEKTLYMKGQNSTCTVTFD